MKSLSVIFLWLASCVISMGAGAINGIAVTAWNGVAITAWNGTGVSAGGGGGGGPLIASVSAGSSDTNNVTTAAIGTAGATLLVAVAGNLAGGAPTLSDSKANTWTRLTVSAGSTVECSIFYSVPSSVGSGHTFTVTTSAKFPALSVAAFSGIHSAPVDQQAGATTSGSQTSVQPGSITPSVDGCLVITGLSLYLSGGNVSINSGFNLIEPDIDFLDGTHFGAALAWKLQTTATATNPTWSHDSAGEEATRITSFKPL